MLRATICALALAAIAGLVLLPASFAEEAKAPQKLVLATDAQAAKALAQFKTDWKARGLKGDDKVSQRDYAMRNISKVHHPDVVAALGKASRDGNSDIRLIALIYLGDQKALPHLAGQHVVKALRKHKKDIVLQLTALQTLGELKYLGAQSDLRDAMKHKYFVVKKAAIKTIGEIGDKRMLKEVLATLGMKLGEDGVKEPEKSGGKEVVEEGYSWEGAEARVDYGDADNTKREIPEAKKKAEAQIAANKAAAEAGRKGGGGGSGAPSTHGGGGRGGSSRSTEELIPTILRTLKALTGEEFDKPSTIRKWVKANKEQLAKDQAALDEKEKAQKAAGS